MRSQVMADLYDRRPVVQGFKMPFRIVIGVALGCVAGVGIAMYTTHSCSHESQNSLGLFRAAAMPGLRANGISSVGEMAQHEEKCKQEPGMNSNALDCSHDAGESWSRKLEVAEAILAMFKSTVCEAWNITSTDSLDTMVFSNEQVIVDKFKQALLAQEKKFVIAFTGTSVAAGHDNFFNQSFPLMTQQLMRPVLLAAGLDLEVRNAAMGNNPVYPYSFCLPVFAGMDADLVVWEFEMMVPGGQQSAALETYLRQTAQMPKKPAVLFMSGTPLFKSACEGPRGNHFRLTDEGYLNIASSMPNGSEASLWTAYRALGPHVLNPRMAFLNTACGNERYSFKHLYEDDKPGVIKAQWHPGPHGHLLVAHAITLGYLRQFVVALRQLAEARTPSGADQLASPPAAVPQVPLSCSPELNPLCDPPLLRCGTFFRPVADSQAGDLRSWLQLPGDVELIDLWELNGTWSPLLQPPGAWQVVVNEPLKLSSMIEQTIRRQGYIDMKHVLAGTRASGAATFNFQTTAPSRLVMLCTPHFDPFENNEDGLPLIANLHDPSHVRFTLDGVTVAPRDDLAGGDLGKGPRGMLAKFPAETCAVLDLQQPVQPGHHKLALEVLDAGVVLRVNYLLVPL